MAKKILGIICIILAVLFSFAFVSQIPKLIGVIIGFSQAQPHTGYAKGYVIGYIIGLSISLGITILLWIYGIKLSKSNDKQDQGIQ